MPRKNSQQSTPAAGRAGPEMVTELRPDAAVSPEMLNVFQQAVSPGAAPGLHLVAVAGQAAGDAMAVSVQAWVRNLAYDKDIFIDLCLLGQDAEVLYADTIPLRYLEPAEGDGDFFALGAAVPAGVPVSGGPSPRTLAFRLYGRMHGQLYTDGALHRHEIPAAAAAAAKHPAKPARAKVAAVPAASPAVPAVGQDPVAVGAPSPVGAVKEAVTKVAQVAKKALEPVLPDAAPSEKPVAPRGARAKEPKAAAKALAPDVIAPQPATAGVAAAKTRKPKTTAER